jgi:hypothetical protein
MDVSGIEPGKDFRKAIDQSVASCSALLAVIGPHWLDARDDAGLRRLDDANDFVRVELASALVRDIRVVPVLVRGARMPRADELPDDLKDLAYRNAVELTHARWKSDVQVLVSALRPYMEAPEAVETANISQETANAADKITGRQTAVAAQAEAATVTVPIESEAIERLGRELAKYIGPIANVLVKRAAKKCNSVEELSAMLARDVPSEADRAKFLRGCRS